MGKIKPNDYSLDEFNIALTTDGFAHPVRKRIIDFLKITPGLTQQDLNRALPLSQSTVAQHLYIMRRAELIQEAYGIHFFPLTINKKKVVELRDYLNEVLECLE